MRSNTEQFIYSLHTQNFVLNVEGSIFYTGQHVFLTARIDEKD